MEAGVVQQLKDDVQDKKDQDDDETPDVEPGAKIRCEAEPEGQHEEILNVEDEVEDEEAKASVALAQVEKTEEHDVATDNVEHLLQAVLSIERGALVHQPTRIQHPVEEKNPKDPNVKGRGKHGDAQYTPTSLTGTPHKVKRNAG